VTSRVENWAAWVTLTDASIDGGLVVVAWWLALAVEARFPGYSVP
jgi:hypothetical protein